MKISAILLATFVLTLLSGLYIEQQSDSYTILRFNIVQPIEWRLGFPLHWLIAQSAYPLNTPWHFAFLWNWFIADFAVYAVIVTIAIIIYERTLKHESRPRIHRIYLWSSSAVLVICCWAVILLTLVYPLWWIRIFEVATALRVLSGLRFLLGVVTLVFVWFLIKYITLSTQQQDTSRRNNSPED